MPQRVPLTPIPSLLPYVITILALALPSPCCHSLPLRLSFVLVLLSLTTHILTSTALPLASLNFSQGAALAAHVFATTDLLLLSDVHIELKRNGQTRAWETMGICERVRWAASLVTSPRLIGWSSTSPTSPSPSPSTPSFILHQSLHLLLELLTLLALLFLSPSLPHLSATGPALASAPWPTRALYTPLLGLAMHASIDAPHRLYTLALLCIANPIICVYNAVSVRPLLLWTPADFRPLFGEWRDAYTLRRFWGRTWQQTHRRKFKAHSRFIKSALITNTTLSRIVDLYTAFLISGLMHAAGEYMMLSSSPSSSSPSSHTSHFLFGGSMRFFILQALGVHIESVVLSFFTRFTAPIPPTPTPTLQSQLILPESTTERASTPPRLPPKIPIPPLINLNQPNLNLPNNSPLPLPLRIPLKIPLKIPTPLLTPLHICGYVWVWTWFAHTAPVLFDPLVKAGFVDDLRASLGFSGFL